MSLKDVTDILQACIEASIYASPTEPGLTVEELCEIGNRVGLKRGEINDALAQGPYYFGLRGRRVMLPDKMWHIMGYLVFAEDPDLRNPVAFDFVVEQLNQLAREIGLGSACLHRSIVLNRAQDQSIPRKDIEVAITLMLLSGQLAEDERGLRFASSQGGERPLPSAGRHQAGAAHIRRAKALRTEVMRQVEDVIARRSDGRAKFSEPFDVFAEQLENLGYRQFRLWWSQVVVELRRTDPNSSPLAALVLAAALVEGSLTFVVKHAQSFGLGLFGSTDFARDPKTWRIDALVGGAARSSDSAILDPQTKNRADGLINSRQRIHAGRMLSVFPTGVPDLRPEEAREARSVAEQVVRKVLDWLEKYPPTSTSV